MNRVRCIKPFGGNFRVSSPFGERIDPITKEKAIHKGIDFACPEGTPIRAVLDGRIIRAGWENELDHKQGYGQRIWQECHLNGTTVLIVYAHLSQINREEGEWADQSAIIGYSGNTGKSTGPHLHLGARVKDTSCWMDFDFEETHFIEAKRDPHFNVKVFEQGDVNAA